MTMNDPMATVPIILRTGGADCADAIVTAWFRSQSRTAGRDRLGI